MAFGRGRTAYEVEMDRLRTKRMNAEPGTLEYAQIQKAIADLQEEAKNDKIIGYKLSKEGRENVFKGLSVLVPGACLSFLNHYLENHEGMLSGRRSKDQDSIMSQVWRSLFSGFGGFLRK